jgi:branched-chain amino acid transport system ATP-binding protein
LTVPAGLQDPAPSAAVAPTDAGPTSLVARVGQWQYRNEVALLLAVLIGIQFLPKRMNAGAYGLGLVSGSLLAMQAIGIVLVYRTNRIINFAQAQIGATAGACFSILVVYMPMPRLIHTICPPCLGSPTFKRSGAVEQVIVGRTEFTINYWISLVLAIALSVALAWIVSIVLVRLFGRAPRLIVTVASLFVVEALPIAADKLLSSSLPSESGDGLGLPRAPVSLPFDATFRISGVLFHAVDVIIVVAAVAVSLGLYVYLRKSATGTAIRAASENPDRAGTLGVDVHGVTTRVWLFVGLLSGLAGILTTTKSGSAGSLDPGTLVLVLFVAVIARFSSLPVALIGALVVGVAQQAALWAFGSPTPLYGVMVGLVALGLIIQRDRLSRAELDQASSFEAARELRGIPRELRQLPVVKRWVRLGVVLGVGTLGVYPWVVSLSSIESGSVAMVYAMMGLSLLVLTGWTGQISLGQFAFAAVGAWVAAVSGLPFLLAVPAGAITGGLVALVVGIPALRLHGLQLAVISLAFALSVRYALVDPSYGGKYVTRSLEFPSFFGFQVGPEGYYYLTLAVLGLVVLAVLGLRRGRFGRVLIAARDNEGAAKSAGVGVVRARLTAFAISGFIAALAGALFAYSQHTVSANEYTPNISIDTFLFAVIGGLGSVAGPLIGGLYALLIQSLSNHETVVKMLTGIGGLLLLVISPGGLAAGLAAVRDAALRRVASRNRIVVSSLMSDRDPGRVSDVGAITPLRHGTRRRGTFVPDMFRLRGQWVLGVADALVPPGASGKSRNGFVDAKPAGFVGLGTSNGAATPGSANAFTRGIIEQPGPKDGAEVAAARVDGLWKLRPSEREAALGLAAQEMPALAEPEEQRERFSARRHFTTWLRNADPRLIEGSKLPVIAASVVGFVHAFDGTSLAIALPNLQATFGLDLQFLIGLGQLMTTMGIVLALPMGYLSDRVKRVRMMQVGTLLAAAASLGQALAPNTHDYVVFRVVGGFAAAVAAPVGASLMADWYPLRSRSRVFAFNHIIMAAGAVLGSAVSGHLIQAFGWRDTWLFLTIATVVAGSTVLFLKEPKRGYLDRLDAGASEEEASKPQQAISLAESFRASYSIVTMRRLWYAIPLGYVVLGGMILLGPLYYSEVFHLSLIARGNLQALNGLIGMIALTFAGPAADRLLATNRPARIITLMGVLHLMQAGILVVMALSPWLWLSVGVGIPLAVGGVLLAPAELLVFSMIVPARMRGVGLQMNVPSKLVGIVLLGVVAGYFGTDPRHAFLIMAPFVVGGALFTFAAAGGVDRDIRAAQAANLAADETEAYAAAGGSKMVVCRDVDVTYDGVQVLFNVDFDVEEGEIVALLGTNGAGKSTLLRAIAGIQQASNGAIFLDGRDITHAPPHENAQRGLVVMPGGAAVFPTMSVDDNLRAAAWMYREDESYIAERLEAVFEFFPILRERRDQLAGNLSGGEQQMVGLGQALLMRPRLLMIDELSLGLAPKVVEQLLDTLRVIHAQGTTIIMVEQSLNVAITIAQRAVFMDKGEIQFSGPVDELMRRPDLIRAVFMGGGTGAGHGQRRAKARLRELDSAATPLLSVERVGVAFGGVKALHEATLTVRHGELVGIIGPNGAGKTTLFDVISGFVTADSGAVVFADADVTRLSPDARARMGLTRSFQNARLFGALTVRENISVFLERRAVKSAALAALWTPMERRAEERISARVDDLIDLLGLGAYAEKFVRELSTGTRRAVDMACVMAAEPKLLLLDEPSSGLAQAETEELGPVLARVAHDTGCGMLVIEHDLPLITSVSDRLVAMELGTVIAQGPTQQVVSDPRVLTSYLSASEAVLSRSDAMGAVAEAIGAVPAGASV